MLRCLCVLLALVSSTFLFGPHCSAGVLLESFSREPAESGWRVFGNPNLFAWDSTNGNLRVTWDSSQANSYYYRPLGTVLARDDDFRIEFDLTLIDIGTGAKSGPFQLAVGLLGWSDATRAEFWRGTGVNSSNGPRNTVEFDYFPAGYYPGWGGVDPSISPTLTSKDNQFASGFTMLELATNTAYHVSLEFTATNQMLRTLVTTNGVSIGSVSNVILGTTFSDFRVDTLAVMSFSDTGNDFDSILAHGTIDNYSITMPALPVSNIAGLFVDGAWRVAFAGRTNWTYALERTTDLKTWTAASATVIGSAETTTLEDAAPPTAHSYYRVRAQKP